MSQSSERLKEALEAWKAQKEKLSVAEAGLSEAEAKLNSAKEVSQEASPKRLDDLNHQVAKAEKKVAELKWDVAKAQLEVARARGDEDDDVQSLLKDIQVKRKEYESMLPGQLSAFLTALITWLLYCSSLAVCDKTWLFQALA